MSGILLILFWTAVGIVLSDIFERLKFSVQSKPKIKRLKSIEGILIATKKEKPQKYSAIIKIKRKRGSDKILEYNGYSLTTANYRGTILISDINPKSGTGDYVHLTQYLARGEFIGFGTISVIIASANQILVNQTYQINNIEVQNPEVWNRVKGNDIGIDVLELQEKYINKLKSTQPEFCVV